jgi:hypothetical protein
VRIEAKDGDLFSVLAANQATTGSKFRQIEQNPGTATGCGDNDLLEMTAQSILYLKRFQVKDGFL